MLVARMCKEINELSSKVKGDEVPMPTITRRNVWCCCDFALHNKSRMFVGSGTGKAQVTTPDLILVVWYHHLSLTYVELVILFIFVIRHLCLSGM